MVDIDFNSLKNFDNDQNVIAVGRLSKIKLIQNKGEKTSALKIVIAQSYFTRINAFQGERE